MRKFLLTFLMATTAAAVTTPALAQRADREERAEEREERRAKAAEARKQRTEARENARPQRAEQPQRAAPTEQRVNRAQPVDRRQDARQQNVNVREQVRDRRATIQQRQQSRAATTAQQRQQQRAATTQQQQQQRDQARQQRVDSRERFVDRANQARRVTPPANARPDRPAPPPQTATTHRAPTWSPTHWRNDRRYDWRNYRDRNRSHFRVGIYFDPFGWNYRRYNVGWRLWPSYYSQDYWLNDPYMYRLPYAPWPYRWVRYYDDAMLVNVFTGQVADVIYDFFW